MRWAPEPPPAALKDAALGGRRGLLVLGGVGVGGQGSLLTVQIGPANLLRPQQLAAFLPRVTPADRRSTPARRIEFRRQAQQVVTALGQQVAREVGLMQPIGRAS